VQDSDPGNRLFMNIPAGNGTFTTAAPATNTGSGVLDAGTVVNKAQWTPDTYTITFGAGGAWTVSGAASGPAGSGTYTGAPGSVVSFNGVQVGLTGTPAPGDTFTVSQAGSQDIFSTLDGMISSLQSGVGNDAQRAQFNTQMNASMQQVDQAAAQLSTVHSQLGARLSMLGDADTARANALTDLQSESTQLSDLDYASAVSKMSQQMLGLQAAQQAFASTSKLSLFNYL